MIRKVTPKNMYGKYFLSVEAPGDDEEPAAEVEEVKPKKKKKDATSGYEDEDTDFNGMIDDEEPEENDEEIDDTDFNALNTDMDDPDVEFDDDDEDEDTDFNGMIDDEEPEEEDAPAEEAEPVQDETPQDDGNVENDTDFNSMDNTDNQEEPATTDNGDTEVTDDEVADNATSGYEDEDTDFNDDSTDDGTDDTGDDTGDDVQAETNGPGLEFDSTRKYMLFKQFMSLYNACDNYLNRVSNKISDDYAGNQILKVSTTKLREIKNLIYDFMTIKFEASSYVQSLVFYQKMVVSIQLVFSLLEKIPKNN